MNSYIIDPKWIYWINVCGAIKGISIGIASCAFITFVIALIGAISNAEYGKDDKDYRMSKVALWISIPILIIFTAAAVFIPSTKLMVEMEVARLATKENVELSLESLKSLVDYIVETIKKIK